MTNVIINVENVLYKFKKERGQVGTALRTLGAVWITVILLFWSVKFESNDKYHLFKTNTISIIYHNNNRHNLLG